MKRTWYHRMLMSYLPIYFFIISVIILVTFLMISKLARQEAIDANQIYVEQQMQALDKSFREIDDMLVKELQYDAAITGFYRGEQDASYISGHETSKKLTQLTATSPLIDSIYLYRFADEMVMSPNMMIAAENFGDNAFARGFREKAKLYTLSDQRLYSEFIDQDYPVSVFSIVRNYPLLGKHQGIIVVNISVPKLKSWLEDISRSERSFLYIVNAKGETIHSGGTPGQGSVLSRVKSSYTGWEFVSGIRDGHLFRFASLLTYVWIFSGLMVIGFLWIMLITKRNYKPIETIINRLQHNSAPRGGKTSPAKDEFKFIDQAVESLIEKSQTYQKLHEEDMAIRRKQLLHDLTEGILDVTQDSWRTEAQAYKLPQQFAMLTLAIYEIDQFAAWVNKYNSRDQYLFKFVLFSVVKEVAEINGTEVWSEWTSNHRLTVVSFYPDNEAAEDRMLSMAEQVRTWVEGNLDFTITAGLSNAYGNLAETSQQFGRAEDALSYKHTIGMNRVIASYPPRFREPYKHLQNIRHFAQSYRLFEANWREMYGGLFTEIRRDVLSREELNNLLSYLAFYLNKEITALSPKTVDFWVAEAFPELSEAIEEYDLLDEPQDRILAILENLEERIALARENRGNLELAKKIRRYMEANLGNPDLSLTLLCDEFGLHGKYLSRIFREEFGEKLVEYMVNMRIDKSKELLATTSMSVADVALSVGYIHDVSFIRAFKKVVGQTPGEYRKSVIAQGEA
ncbi:MAG: transcriptional regulator, AraC family [Paenibacillaceae bacterium]|jgi:AraC-like DNA-binding protein|nr:transcriptional regulator, AraC family [Paenibacillaceae bacterium]